MSVFAENPLVDLAACGDHGCLIYGIGNVSRQDDGLGWAFIDHLEREGMCPQAELMRHYQLQLEDADLINGKRRVLFVDATRSPEVDVLALERVRPNMDSSFTSHAVSVSSILAACEICFQTLPEVWLLTIRGYEWTLQSGLTPKATANLTAVIDCFRSAIATNVPKSGTVMTAASARHPV
jgi:hydrogenase maturation protease